MKKLMFRLSLLIMSTIAYSGTVYGGITYANAVNEVKEYKLDNGLQILVKEDHRAPVAIVQLWYKVGSAYENNGKTGLSHALEHMMFKGTSNYPLGKYEQLIYSKGGQYNAFTSRDYTDYYVKIAAKELPLVFALEADRMRGIVLTEDDFAKERKVIIEERLLRVDDQPTELAEEKYNVTAYATNGYQQPTIGWMDDIKALTIDDLRQWHAAWYSPNNAILTVAGNVAAEEVFKLAQQHFGNISSSNITEIKPRKALSNLGMRRLEIKQSTKTPRIFMGYNVPSLNTADLVWEPYALDVLAYLLAGSDSSICSKRMIRNTNMAVSVDVRYSPYDLHSTLLTFDAVPTSGNTLSQLEQVLISEIQQLQSAKVSAQDLERVKTQIVAEKAYANDFMFFKAYELGKLVASGYDWRESENYSKKIQAVTLQQVQDVANKFMINDNLTVAHLIPR